MIEFIVLTQRAAIDLALRLNADYPKEGVDIGGGIHAPREMCMTESDCEVRSVPLLKNGEILIESPEMVIVRISEISRDKLTAEEIKALALGSLEFHAETQRLALDVSKESVMKVSDIITQVINSGDIPSLPNGPLK